MKKASMLNSGPTILVGVLVLNLLLPLPARPQVNEREGVVLGRVYEVDKEKYEAFVERLRRQDTDFDESLLEIDPHDFVDERKNVSVTGRQLTTSMLFESDETNASGDYTIEETPVGTFEFFLSYEGMTYPVQQRLDLNVQLSYVAELCFVIDREEEVAWMVVDGDRRTPDVPPWVPRKCTSALSECLAGVFDPDDKLPDGLLLLLAGSGAAAAAVGIISTDQVEASPPNPNNQR